MAPPWLPAKKVPAPFRAWFPVNVQAVTQAVPRFSRPPPKTSRLGPAVAWLLTTKQRVRFRVAPASLRIPPPPSASPDVPAENVWPLAIVRLARVTVAPLPISKTRLALLPLMVSLSAPGPLMFRLLVIFSSPSVSLMVSWLGRANTIVSAPLAIPARNVGSFGLLLSASLVTVNELSKVRFSIGSSRGTNRVHGDRGPRRRARRTTRDGRLTALDHSKRNIGVASWCKRNHHHRRRSRPQFY